MFLEGWQSQTIVSASTSETRYVAEFVWKHFLKQNFAFPTIFPSVGKQGDLRKH
jgi:hypothetical protein